MDRKTYSFVRLLATYSRIGILPNRIYLVRVNKYVIPTTWTRWTPSLLIGPLANGFVIGAAYYFLFKLKWSGTMPTSWEQRVILDLPWLAILLSVYLTWRDVYSSIQLWKANKLGLLGKDLPLRINL